MSAAPVETLVAHTLALCAAARAAGLRVTPARAIDVFRALDAIAWDNYEDYRLALRTNLVSSREDEILFEHVYARYWGTVEDPAAGDHIMAHSEFLRGDLPAGRANEAHREMRTEADTFAADEVARRANLAARWDADAPPLDQVIRALARRLATRPSRRQEPARHGARIDLRRSLRASARHGFDLVELTRSRRKLRKTRIVMLCDVSGSMDAFNPFLFQLMFGVQQALKSSRTVVFSTRTSEITALLRRRSIDATLQDLADKVRHWSGGTDIGAALGELNRGILREGAARSTVLIIISDGYDHGETARIVQELECARRRIRTLVWINPMFGASTFTVRAAGMQAALPFVDHFLPAFNGKALQVLVRGLAALA